MNYFRKFLIIGWAALLIQLPLPTSALVTGAPDQLSVLTYNVYTALGAPGIQQRLNLIAENGHLAGYDIVILTEMFRDEASKQLLDAMLDVYPYQTRILGRDIQVDPDCEENECWNSIEGEIGTNQIEDGGVAILSKWPILDRRQYVYQTRCGIDALSRKGFAYIQIDVKGVVVHVIGTHLQADPPSSTGLEEQIEGLFACEEPNVIHTSVACAIQWDSPFEAVRLNQMIELDAWIKQQALPSDQLVVIGGDLNIDKEGSLKEYSQMLCILQVNEPIYEGDPALDPPWYTFDSESNQLIDPGTSQLYIDYVLLRENDAQPIGWCNTVLRPSAFPDNWDYGSLRGYELSDHFPVVGFIPNLVE